MNAPVPPSPPLRPVEEDPADGQPFLIQCSWVGEDGMPLSSGLAIIDGWEAAGERVAALQAEAEGGEVYHATMICNPEDFPWRALL